IQMKKNRPAAQIQVLCDLGARDGFVELLLRHTTTFGVRVLEVERVCLPRHKETIETDLGPVEIKVGFWGDDVLKITPEYESCRRLARSAGLPLAEVYLRAQAVISRRMDRERGAQVVRPAAKKRAKP
ncbi:MAG TPA: nickel insertion protein, partial [Sumerlaeia bacterium]|nr:nickel insertion protein [Sumerlaeia bacterium]